MSVKIKPPPIDDFVDDAGKPGLLPASRKYDDPTSCESYERLIRELETRDTCAEDFEFLEKHEAACPTGQHTEAGVEETLGLPRGALRHGSPEHGLENPRRLISDLINKYLSIAHVHA